MKTKHIILFCLLSIALIILSWELFAAIYENGRLFLKLIFAMLIFLAILTMIFLYNKVTTSPLDNQIK